MEHLGLEDGVARRSGAERLRLSTMRARIAAGARSPVRGRGGVKGHQHGPEESGHRHGLCEDLMHAGGSVRWWRQNDTARVRI
jgi:hypothetical protein